MNDRIIDFLIPRIYGRYVDIGCNSGWLLSERTGGIGVDANQILLISAAARGFHVAASHAESLPFVDGAFDLAVLSCVLEQCTDWRIVISEARRVARSVIGINPIPGASCWGTVQGWVRSVIAELDMHALGFLTERIDAQRYFFEWT